jgi:ketosteroid isomerase-like protein
MHLTKEKNFVFVFLAIMILMNTTTLQAQSGERRPSSREARAQNEIRRVLDAQVAAWNQGDIEGFMDGYARGDETTFVSGDTVTRGWQTVLDRYRRGYTSRERMGTLTFSELTIDVINRDTAIVLGRWQLQRTSDVPRGRFTLIFRRHAGAWRIVHDHTSSAS